MLYKHSFIPPAKQSIYRALHLFQPLHTTKEEKMVHTQSVPHTHSQLPHMEFIFMLIDHISPIGPAAAAKVSDKCVCACLCMCVCVYVGGVPQSV